MHEHPVGSIRNSDWVSFIMIVYEKKNLFVLCTDNSDWIFKIILIGKQYKTFFKSVSNACASLRVICMKLPTKTKILRPKTIDSLLPYFHWSLFWFVETPVYCPENYQLYNGRCFGVPHNLLNFSDAEAECNKLPGGHLAAFRSVEEWDLIKNLWGF